MPLPSLSFFLFCNVFLSYLDAPLLAFQVFKLKYSWVAISQLVAQTVKNLPAVQETRVQSLGQEDPLEEGMAAHSSILAWRIPQTEEPEGLQSIG